MMSCRPAIPARRMVRGRAVAPATPITRTTTSEAITAAERALKAQRATAEVKKRPPIRVRTSVQPTFVRYVFEVPSDVRVASTLTDDEIDALA